MTAKRSFPLMMVLALLALAPAAQAAPVMVVGPDGAVVREDPFVPERTALPAVPRKAGASASASTRASRSTKRGRRAVTSQLRRALRKKQISRKRYRSYLRTYARARGTLRNLRGARRTQLGYVISTLESLARRKRLTASRMPAQFLQLGKNALLWRGLPYPSSGSQVTFRGSELLYEYYPGRGVQLQPLSNFKKANMLHGACERGEGACSERRLRKLLDELTRLAVRRSRRFIAWEYNFYFGGGSPPWMSGMAQATAVQAYARAAKLLERPSYLRTARKAFGAFRTRPPLGVRTTGPMGGTHYLQYSFAPRLFIFNAFMQSVIGLYDYAKITGDRTADSLWRAAEPEARRELPASDVGDWTRYSYRGNESTHEYHELLREFMQSLCSRLKGTYCTYARRYQSYQSDPAELELTGPETATKGRTTTVRFSVDKLSAVQLTITKNGRVSTDKVATFRRGSRGFSWKPGGTGVYDVRLAAKELRTGRGLRTRTSGEIEVAAP